MNVLTRWRVHMLCLISVFFGYKLEMSCCTKWWGKDNNCRKIGYWLWSEYSFFFKDTLLISNIIICSLSNPLLCDRLVRRGQKVVAEKLIMFCEKSVHTLFKLTFKKYERSAVSFVLGFFDGSCSLFTWQQRKEKIHACKSCSTLKISFSIMWNYSILLRHFCKYISVYFHVTIVGLK